MLEILGKKMYNDGNNKKQNPHRKNFIMNTNNFSILPTTLNFSGEDTRKRQYLSPVKIVKTWGDVKNAELLLERSWIQAILHTDAPSCSMVSKKGQAAAILLDYGCELHGCVRIVTAMHKDKDGKNVTYSMVVCGV